MSKKLTKSDSQIRKKN